MAQKILFGIATVLLLPFYIIIIMFWIMPNVLIDEIRFKIHVKEEEKKRYGRNQN